MMNKERNYGIDFLRIVAMFMVIILHILGRGGILDAVSTFSPNYYIVWFMEIASFGAVNCYAIISGYVGYNKKTKYSNLTYIILCAVFYLLTLTTVGYFSAPVGDVESVKNSLLHIRVVDGWWYLKAYFVAFFIFPYINLIVEKYDRKKLYLMIAGVFILFSVIPTLACSDIFMLRGGYSPWWLLLMYFVGAVIKKYDAEFNVRKIRCFWLYILSILLVFLMKTGIDYISSNHFDITILNEYMITYVSPLILLSSVFLVLLFRKVKTNQYAATIIAFMSPLTFGVYLIHTQYYVWEYLDKRFVHYASMEPVWLVIYVLLTAIIIYLICSALDFARQYIFKLFRIKKSNQTER